MLNWMRGRRTLDEVLNETKLINVVGVVFEIKKIDPETYITGSDALTKLVDVYENKKANEKPGDMPKLSDVKKHMREMFLAAVIEPKLARNEDDDGTPIDNLFTDWSLVNGLYEEIVQYTYGKKKDKLNTMQRGS